MKDSGVNTGSPIVSTKDNQLIQIKLLKDILEGIPVVIDTTLLAKEAKQDTEIARLTSILAALGGALTVIATNLDIRDLVFASDKVDVSGSTAVGVTGPLTDAQLRLTPVPVSGTVTTGGLTDTQLRATPVPVSGTVTVDTSLLSTSANQTTEIARLTSILAQLDVALSTRTKPADQQHAIIDSGVITLPVGASTGTKQDTGNTSLASIDTKLTSPISTALVAASAVVSTVNSTTTPLGNGGVFTGSAELTDTYATISVFAFSDVDSATNGLSIQFSQNGTNWDFVSTTSLTASDGIAMVISPIGRYFRIVYTNGATPQSLFRLQIKYHSVALTPVILPLSTPLTADIPSIITHSIIGGRTTAGGGSFVDVKVSPSGAIQVGGTATVDGEVSVTDLDTLATEASLQELIVDQGDDASSLPGPLVLGLVNDAPQSYENNQARALSLNSEGRLRVSNVDFYFDKIWQGTFEGNPYYFSIETVSDSSFPNAGEISHV